MQVMNLGEAGDQRRMEGQGASRGRQACTTPGVSSPFHDRGRIDAVENTENCDAVFTHPGVKWGISDASKDVNIHHSREKLYGGDCSRCSTGSADCRFDREKVQVEFPVQGDVEEETLLL